MTWHLDDDAVAAWATGRVMTPAQAASVETHVERCASCRLRVAPAVDTGRLDAVWDRVVEQVDAPRLSLVEQLLIRAGVDPATARLLAVTPSLRLSWLAGTVGALLLALLVAHSSDRGVGLFLALAPVLPVAGVAMAFGPRTEALHEVALAAPYSAYRLLLVRSAVVVATTIALALPATVLLPSTPLVAVAWLLPALALASTSLALAPRVDPVFSSAVLAAGWLLLALTALAPDRDPLVVATLLPQVLSAALFALALAALLVQRGSPSLSGSPA